jgi:hypothetical protein
VTRGLVLFLATLACVAVLPSASARQQRAQGDPGSAVVAQVAQAGVNAAIAQWAPDLAKHVDPNGAALAQISAQLQEIDRKLAQLIDHQAALGAKLSCEVQRVALSKTLSEVKAWYARLLEAGQLADPAARVAVLEALYSQYSAMLADQDHIHRLLHDGLIRACAQHIELSERPYLSAALAYNVHDFYAVYHTAAVELLVVRANMIALHPAHFAPTAAQAAAKSLETAWTGEASLIKPHFPGSMSYDTDTKALWRFQAIPWNDAAQRATLAAQGWHVTGHSTTPTCSAVEAFVRKSGYTGTNALHRLTQLNVLAVPTSGPTADKILCYDDHDRLHEFSLATYSYSYAGDIQSHAPSVAARQNDGMVDISAFSYVG